MQTAAFDAASNSGYQAAASTYNWSHTCSGNARVLVVSVELFSIAQTVTGITYNGVALTRIDNSEATIGALLTEMWALIAPATGAHSIAVTLSGSIASCGTAVSLTGISQAGVGDGVGSRGPFGGAGDVNVGATDALVTGLNSDFAGGLIVAAVATDDTSVTAAGAGQTIRANVTGALGSGVISTCPEASDGTFNQSFTGIGALKSWAIGGVAFYPAPDAPVITDPADDPHSLTVSQADAQDGQTVFTGAYTEADGDTATFSVSGPDAAHFDGGCSGGIFAVTVTGGDLAPGSYDVTVTLTNAGGSDSVRLLITVEASVPTIVTAPVVAAFHMLGKTLTSDRGTWANDPTSYTERWQRANDGSGTGAANITGATAQTYVVVLADSGKYLRIGTIATNDDGDSTESFSAWMYVYPVVGLPAPTLVTRNLDALAGYDTHFLLDDTISNVSFENMPSSPTWKNQAPQNATRPLFFTVGGVSTTSGMTTLPRSNGSGWVKISRNCALCAGHVPGDGDAGRWMKADGTIVSRASSSYVDIGDDCRLRFLDTPLEEVDIPSVALPTPSCLDSLNGFSCLSMQCDRSLHVHTLSASSASQDLTISPDTTSNNSGKPVWTLNNGTPILLMSGFLTTNGGPNLAYFLNEIAAAAASVGDTVNLVEFKKSTLPASSPVVSPVHSPVFSPIKIPALFLGR